MSEENAALLNMSLLGQWEHGTSPLSDGLCKLLLRWGTSWKQKGRWVGHSPVRVFQSKWTVSLRTRMESLELQGLEVWWSGRDVCILHARNTASSFPQALPTSNAGVKGPRVCGSLWSKVPLHSTLHGWCLLEVSPRKGAPTNQHCPNSLHRGRGD